MSARGLITTGFNINVTFGDSGPVEFAPMRYAYRPGSAFEVYQRSIESTTECITLPPGGPAGGSASPGAPAGASAGGGPSGVGPSGVGPSGGAATPALPSSSAGGTASSVSGPGAATSAGPGTTGGGPELGGVPLDERVSVSSSKLHALVQHIYAAQARVQLEATEIKKAQGMATSAQKALEEAANNVRVITAALHTAQQEVAAAAVRAQSAQLQLAAHDQLLFAARQRVDALSARMVGLQAEDGVIAPPPIVNLQSLLAQLKEPIPQAATPTPIPPVDLPDTKLGIGVNPPEKPREAKGFFEVYEDYVDE